MADKLKTLIIEDSKPIQVIYDAGLSSGVFEKYFEKDGNEALEVYNTWHPDIIVLDIMIHGMSGYLLLKEIRQEKNDQTTTVIVASSISDREAVVDILKLGIQGYLVKPFTHKEISQKILDSYKKMNPERADAAFAALEVEHREKLAAQKAKEAEAKAKEAEEKAKAEAKAAGPGQEPAAAREKPAVEKESGGNT
jgi:DNA-binding response OmpR family regulator